MALMRVVETPVHEKVDVVAVRHRLVAAAPTMMMAAEGDVAGALAADVGIDIAHGNSVFGHACAFRTVEVTVMQVTDMVVVPDRNVSAFAAVLMIVTFVCVCHAILLKWALRRHRALAQICADLASHGCSMRSRGRGSCHDPRGSEAGAR